MRKTINKFKRKARKTEAESTTSNRITNETVAEHREKILAGGRKFKYPHQYVRHKLVINAIIISVVVLIAMLVAGWLALYKLQATNEFMYRVTRVLPVPVASVDGQMVRYSDYLMRYRSQELWLGKEGQLGIDKKSDEKQLNFIKRRVLDSLEKDIYAEKRAKDLGITVADTDVDAVIRDNRRTATGEISQEVYDASTKDTLGYSPEEYRRIIRQSLLRQRVAYEVDTGAAGVKKKVEEVLDTKKAKNSLRAAADVLEKQGVKVEFGASGLVPRNNQDGGLSRVAGRQKDNQISDAVKSTTGDGYYFVQKLSGNDRQVSYQFIKIPLTAFEQQFNQARKDNKVQEFIAVKQIES